MSQLVNLTMSTAMPLSELGPQVFPGEDASAGRHGGDGAAGARQRRPPVRARGGPAAVPRPRVLPRPARPVGMHRPGLPGAAPRTAVAGPQAPCTPSPGMPARAAPGSSSCTPAATAGRRMPAGTPTTSREPSFLWNEPGAAFRSVTGEVTELLRARPAPRGALRSSRCRAGGPGPDYRPPEPAGPRRPYPPGVPAPARPSPARQARRTRTRTTRKRQERPGRAGSSGRAGFAVPLANFGRSSVQDHQTKGDQPFQALITRQIEVQPPGAQPSSDFAPLRGRKVLAFSDSRQTAARLAPNLQNYSMRDVLRPLIMRGWRELSSSACSLPRSAWKTSTWRSSSARPSCRCACGQN